MKQFLYALLALIVAILFIPTALVRCFTVHSELPAEVPPTAPHVRVWDGTQVSEIDLEKYLEGVVAGEMPASFHTEALKAQAVAARTYIYNKMTDGVPDEIHPDADVCTDSTHCKAHLSDDVLKNDMGDGWYEAYYPRIHAAVADTSGEIILYNNAPIVAVFHSTGSGRTENSADVWGGNLPYLKSVESVGDAESPKFTSDVAIPKSEISVQLGVEPVIGAYTHSEGGAVLTVDIGGKLFKGTDIRSKFGLNSANFVIEDTPDSFIFHVKGHGHGVGLSQYGAEYLAKTGVPYHEILTTYYTDVSIEKLW